MKIGIFGGTFNPIHNGHLHAAREAAALLALDTMILMVSYLPPHKRIEGNASAEDRLAMARIAAANDPLLEISPYEIEKKGTSFSVAAIRQLKRIYGSDAELFFVAGADALRDLHTWKDIDEIYRLSKFVIVNRPGFAMRNIPSEAAALRIQPLAISSSAVRSRVKKGLSIKGLVAAGVAGYITKKRLYR